MNNVCTEQMRSFSQCICCNVHFWDNAERCNIMEITSIFLYKPLQAKTYISPGLYWCKGSVRSATQVLSHTHTHTSDIKDIFAFVIGTLNIFMLSIWGVGHKNQQKKAKKKKNPVIFLDYDIIFLRASMNGWCSCQTAASCMQTPALFLIYIKGFAIYFLHVEGACLSAWTYI